MEEGQRDEWVDPLIPPVAVIIIVEQPRFLKIGLEERQATQRKLIDWENWDRLHSSRFWNVPSVWQADGQIWSGDEEVGGGTLQHTNRAAEKASQQIKVLLFTLPVQCVCVSHRLVGDSWIHHSLRPTSALEQMSRPMNSLWKAALKQQ